MSFYQIPIFDIIAALWVATVFAAIFFWIPSPLLTYSRVMMADNRTARTWTRMAFVAVLGVLGLNALHLFNWFTSVVFYGLFLFLVWLNSRSQETNAPLQLVLQKTASIVLDLLDRGLFAEFKGTAVQIWQNSGKRLSPSLKAMRIAIARHKFLFVSLVVVLTFAILLRFDYPLLELRFSNPDRYSTLLATRQLIAGDRIEFDRVPILSILAAIVSLVGAVDAMQAIRFLCPLLGILLVLSVGYCVRSLTQNGTAALIASFSLGAYLFTWQGDIPSQLPDWWKQWLSVMALNLNASLVRQWTVGEIEIGAMFLLLAIACFSNLMKQQANWVDAICCLALVAMSEPTLLILAFVGAIALTGGRIFALLAVAIAWISFASLAASPDLQWLVGQSFLLTLPVGLSLLAGFLSLVAIWFLRAIVGQSSEPVCLILAFALSVNFLLPLPPKISYVEYDTAARKTIEIRDRFDSKSWVVVAPVEQLAQSYGAGWYEDLAMFVQKYALKVYKPDFKFPYSVPHLFIYVEKKPFVTSAAQSQDIPHSLLSDPTYRHYRSSAGRSSLQFEALQMCEAYRRIHANTSIYYEDDELRIYHINQELGVRSQ